MSKPKYNLQRSGEQYVLTGPALEQPSYFDSEEEALSLVRVLIGPRRGILRHVDSNGSVTREEDFKGTLATTG